MEKIRTEVSTKKIEEIFLELSQTPFTGLGSPEPLKYQLNEYWSRRIDRKNRIVYQVQEDIVLVVVISAKGHYD
jgi:toxin YoeB